MTNLPIDHLIKLLLAGRNKSTAKQNQGHENNALFCKKNMVQNQSHFMRLCPDNWNLLLLCNHSNAG